MLNLVGWTTLAALSLWSLRTAPLGGPTTLGWRWWLLTGIVLFSFRYPLIGASTGFNPDEALLIAGAFTLKHDLVCWRSIDGMTAGPLVFYPLLPATCVYGLPSYIIARVIALGGVLGTLIFTGEAASKIFGTLVSRLAGLPAMAFVAFTTTPDLTFYSTEITPLLLLSAAVWFGARETFQCSRLNLWGAGILLGAAPWGKLQVAPLAVLIWVLLAWYEAKSGRKRAILVLLGAGLVPSVGFVFMASVTGQIEQVIIPYLLNNFVYLNAGKLSWSHLLAVQFRNAVDDGYIAIWIGGTGSFAAISLWLQSRALREDCGKLFAALLLLLVALACVLAPRREYTHYLHFLELPLLLLSAALFGRSVRRASPRSTRIAAIIFLVFTLMPQLMRRLSNPARYSAYQWTSPATHEQLLKTIRNYSNQGEPLAIWGWYPALHVDSGMYQATREGQNEPQINPGPWRSFFRSRYMLDLKTSNPPLFIDSVGPGNIFGDRRHAHESFPELKVWIGERYRFVAEIASVRIYVRSDRLKNRPSH